VTGIKVNSEAYFPNLRKYCPSAERIAKELRWLISASSDYRELRISLVYEKFKKLFVEKS